MLKTMLMQCGQLTGAVAVASAIATNPAFGDVLLDQPTDLRNCWHSFYSPAGRQKADDFRPSEDVVVESVTCIMVSTWPNLPRTFSLGVYRGFFDHPAYPFAPFTEHFFRQFNPSSVTDLGPWPHDENLRLVEVRFDNLGLLLEAGAADLGVYWFACAGHLSNYPTDKCYWATANTDAPNDDVGYTKAHPVDYPGWVRISDRRLPPSDFAMRIEGVPAAEWRPTTELTAFEVDYGRDVEGDLDDLRDAGDDTVVTFKSNPGRRDGQKYYVASITTTARCLLDDADMLDVSVSADVQRLFRVPDAILFLRNWSTGEWDEVGRHEIYVERDTWPFRDIPASDYVSSDGVIELRFEVRAGPLTGSSERVTGYFVANIDRVRIDARRVD
jgi:hypothetical protein